MLLFTCSIFQLWLLKAGRPARVALGEDEHPSGVFMPWSKCRGTHQGTGATWRLGALMIPGARLRDQKETSLGCRWAIPDGAIWVAVVGTFWHWVRTGGHVHEEVAQWTELWAGREGRGFKTRIPHDVAVELMRGHFSIEAKSSLAWPHELDDGEEEGGSQEDELKKVFPILTTPCSGKNTPPVPHTSCTLDSHFRPSPADASGGKAPLGDPMRPFRTSSKELCPCFTAVLVGTHCGELQNFFDSECAYHLVAGVWQRQIAKKREKAKPTLLRRKKLNSEQRFMKTLKPPTLKL